MNLKDKFKNVPKTNQNPDVFKIQLQTYTHTHIKLILRRINVYYKVFKTHK